MLTGDKVGTAKNIATACNILPADADVLELTAEKFPVLDELKTSEIARVQQRLADASREAARPSRLRRLLCLPPRRPPPGAPAPIAELTAQTEALDRRYPELKRVRGALAERQAQVVKHLSRPRHRRPRNLQICLVIDEKVIECCMHACMHACTHAWRMHAART